MTTATVLQNHIRDGGFIQSEANYSRSRDMVTIDGGTGGAGQLYAGCVLGKVTATGKYIPSAATGSDGSQTAIAILWGDTDATAGDVVAAIVARDAEVRAADLNFDTTVDDNTKKAAKYTQLAAVGIIVRTSTDTQAA